MLSTSQSSPRDTATAVESAYYSHVRSKPIPYSAPDATLAHTGDRISFDRPPVTRLRQSIDLAAIPYASPATSPPLPKAVRAISRELPPVLTFGRTRKDEPKIGLAAMQGSLQRINIVIDRNPLTPLTRVAAFPSEKTLERSKTLPLPPPETPARLSASFVDEAKQQFAAARPRSALTESLNSLPRKSAPSRIPAPKMIGNSDFSNVAVTTG